METVRIPSRGGHPVVADVYPAGDNPVVVMCHGFKGHRRWGFIPRLAGRLCDAGCTVVAMDFSLNGRLEPGGTAVGDGFPDPDAFRRNTIARELDDLLAAIAWVRRGGADRVGLWGHSRGGVAALLAALETPDIAAVVTWSAAAHPDFYTARQKEQWRERGEVEFVDGATGTPLALDVAYLDDLEANAARYALAERAGSLRSPHLIVHGEQDMVIPVSEAVELYDTEQIAADKKLIRLATGHTFGYEDGKEPSEALAAAIEKTVAWFDEYLPITRSDP